MAAVPVYDPNTQTLHVNIAPVHWTREMHAVYRFLCAPSNPDFQQEAFTVAGSITEDQVWTLALALSQNKDIDLAANKDYISHLFK